MLVCDLTCTASTPNEAVFLRPVVLPLSKPASLGRLQQVAARDVLSPRKSLCPGAPAMAELFRPSMWPRSPPLQPCLPRPAKEPPVGPDWIHEIKHDGFRILARRAAKRVRLITRHGTDFTARYPKIAAALDSLPVRSCALDGEAIVVNEHGLSVFDLIRYRQHDHDAVLCAFDLIELDGEDLRWQPVERRKAMLADLLRGTRDGIAFNQHYEGDGAAIFEHACALGCEGIVSKRLGSHYRSGRVDHWLKIKNPAAPAVKREAEEGGAISDGPADDESEPAISEVLGLLLRPCPN